jgi:hypothetical protein
MSDRPARVASGLMHPLPLIAMATLLANDHYLKANWGHPITGKLSDVAGLLFFPLLLVAIVEVGQAVARRYRGPSVGVLVAAVLATGVVFSLVQLASPVTEGYRVVLAALQQPLAALEGWQSGGWDALPRVRATADPSDLLALPALAVAYLVGARGCAARR